MRELGRRVARVPAVGVRALFDREVHARVREVGEAPSVVRVGVGENDVGHVRGAKADALDLARRGEFFAELEPRGADGRAADPFDGAAISARPIPVSTSASRPARSSNRQWHAAGGSGGAWCKPQFQWRTIIVRALILNRVDS